MKTKDQLLGEIETLKKRINDLENTQTQNNLESNPNLYSTKPELKKRPNKIPQFYKNIIEGIQDGFWVADKNNVIFYTNSAMEKIAGVTKDKILGKNVLTDFPKETTEEFNKFYIQAKKSLTPVWYEVTVKTPAGRDTWQNGWLIPLVKNNKFDGITCTIRDVTKRVQTEQNLKESEEKFKAYTEYSPIAIYTTDKNGDCTYANNKWLEMAGLSLDEAKGKGWVNALHPDDKLTISENWYKSVSSGGEWKFEYRFVDKKGKISWVEGSAKEIKDTRGNLIGYVGSNVDVTERKTAENKLKQSEARFRSYIENSPLGIFEIDAKGNYINVNQAASKITGYSEKELLKMNVLDFNFDKESHEAAKKRFGNFIKTGVLNVISPFKRKNGEIGWWQLNAIRLDERKLLGFTVDITEQHNSEVALKESEEKFRNFAEQSIDAFTLVNEKGDILLWNSAMERITGFLHKDIFHKKIWEVQSQLLTGDYPENFTKIIFDKMIQNIKRGNFNKQGQNSTEISVKRKDGKKRILEQKSFTIAAGEKRLLAGIVRDITEKKQAEILAQKQKQQILDANADLQLAQKIAKIGHWQLDPTVGVPVWSDYIFKIYERNPKDGPIAVSEYINIYEPEQYHIFINAIKAAINKGKSYDIILKLSLQKGKTKWVRAICQPDLNFKTEKGYFLRGTIQDITSRKNIEIELKNALEKAQESDKLKSAFLANMSHEIRTPMNGILGFTSLLKDPNLSKQEQKKYIEIVEKSGLRMLNTINDLIDISRIEAGETKITNSKFDIDEQLRYLYTFFKPEAQNKNIELILNIQENSKKKELFTDKDKFYAILSNLIKNAIKYTEKGSIEFGYKILPGKLEFYVKDTGIGIDSNRLKAVFDRFVQEDLTITKPHEGAGLGLAISKGFADLIGGKIKVESKKGEGSVFFLTMPFPHMEEDEIIPEVKPEIQHIERLKDLTILLVEDEFISESYFTVLLQNKCKSLLTAHSGIEAIEMVKKNKNIDVVLMDIKMPELDGYSATKKIRNFNGKVKIIAQTAFAQSGEREKAIETGCDDYLAKPINKDQLVNAILRLF